MLNDHNYGLIEELPTGAVVAAPFVTLDFPAPTRASRPAGLHTWINSPIPPAAVVAAPFATRDFPVPRAKAPTPDASTWISNGFRITDQPVIAYLPCGVTGFDYPQAVRPVSLQTWVQRQQLVSVAGAAPFTNYDFPVPGRAPRSIDLATWVQNPEIVPVSYTFREALVSVPVAVRRANPALDTWTQSPTPAAAAAFKAYWVQQNNLPVIGTGTY